MRITIILITFINLQYFQKLLLLLPSSSKIFSQQLYQLLLQFNHFIFSIIFYSNIQIFFFLLLLFPLLLFSQEFQVHHFLLLDHFQLINLLLSINLNIDWKNIWWNLSNIFIFISNSEILWSIVVQFEDYFQQILQLIQIIQIKIKFHYKYLEFGNKRMKLFCESLSSKIISKQLVHSFKEQKSIISHNHLKI